MRPIFLQVGNKSGDGVIRLFPVYFCLKTCCREALNWLWWLTQHFCCQLYMSLLIYAPLRHTILTASLWHLNQWRERDQTVNLHLNQLSKSDYCVPVHQVVHKPITSHILTLPERGKGVITVTKQGTYIYTRKQRWNCFWIRHHRHKRYHRWGDVL